MYFNRHISRQITRQVDFRLSISLLNSEIKSSVLRGQYGEALQLYSRHPLHVARFSYPSLLKACAALSNLQYGKIIHSNIIATAVQFDQYITASLINMYIKCGSLKDAVQLFDELPEKRDRDVTVWNSIIDGYFRFGHYKVGLLQFHRMQSSGVRPDSFSLCILLVRQNGLGLKEGKQIHGYIVRNLLTSDPFLETALLDMYFSYCRPADAWSLFIESKHKSNIVVWNVIIGGFEENGFWEKSLELFILLKNNDVKPVSSSYTNTLSACGQGEFLSIGEQVHCEIIKASFDWDPFVCTALLTMYAKCRLIECAEKIFIQLSNKEIELWNALISAYVGNGCAYNALKSYNRLRLCEIQPDPFTISNILSICCLMGFYDFGRCIHTELVKRPIEKTVNVQSALLTMYSKCGNTDDANSIFITMRGRDVVVWGSIISGFCQNRKYKEALEFFREMEGEGVKPDSDIVASIISACTGAGKVDMGSMIHGLVIKNGFELDVFVASSLVDMYSKFGFLENAEAVFSNMPSKNLVAWNSMIACYWQNGLPELSIDLFSQNMHNGSCPDSVAITSILAAVSSVAALLKGKSVHGYLIRHGTLLDLQVENTLIDMYMKCGLMKYAQYTFQNMSNKNLVTWNLMISGYGSHGENLKTLRLFEEMINSGARPDDVTFLSLLSSCSHSGLVKEGLNLFELMKTEYKMEPRMDHYVNVVDLLGRAGLLEDACLFVDNMPIKPDSSIWLSLLGSCRTHNNLKVGEIVANKLLELEPNCGSHYIQLLNLYGESELWDRATSLRASMKEKGLKKTPGSSRIEV